MKFTWNFIWDIIQFPFTTQPNWNTLKLRLRHGRVGRPGPRYVELWQGITSNNILHGRKPDTWTPKASNWEKLSVFTSHVIKTKIVTIQWIKSRILDTIDDWYINNLAKNQVSAVFHSRVICRSVSPKFIELCMETPSLCPLEGHKHGGRKVT